MVLTEAMMDEIRDDLNTKAQAMLLMLSLGTDDTTDEGPTNTDLDARIAATDRAIFWAWDEERQELTAEVIYGFDGADAEGSESGTNGNTLKEMGIYDGDPDAAGVLQWRHTFTDVDKTTSFRFKVELTLRFIINET